MRRTFTILALALALGACDQPQPPPPAPQTTGAATTAAVAEPFTITPKLWGDAAASDGATYEVRAMEDGKPGLFDADGQLLVELLPELLLDLGHGKKRVVPRTRAFELVSLDPYENGGFRLLARLEDASGTFDLKVEAGPNDPRVHVGLTTRWGGDVEVNRQVLLFRLGAVGNARAVQHDLRWAEVEDEWASSAHAPKLVTFERGLFVHARHGTEALVVRSDATQWRVELEAYHTDNHPVAHGEPCGATLEGGAKFKESERTELRADFVIGEVAMPLLERWPAGDEAAVAVLHPAADTPRSLAATPDGVQWQEGAFWAGEHADARCEGGRYTFMAARGARAAFGGGVVATNHANMLQPTETDARRVVAFEHPNLPLPMFVLPDALVTAAMLESANLAEVRAARGLVLGRADADVDAARAELATDNLWFASPNDVTQRLVSLDDVDLDLLPEGVIRVRNLGDAAIDRLALRLPAGVTARAPDADGATVDDHSIAFDLAPRGSQLIQLFSGDAPAAAPAPLKGGVQIAVVRDQ